MSNYFTTKVDLTNYITARTPLIIVQTSERERIERMISSISEEKGIEIYYYTDPRQITVFNSGNTSASINAGNDPLKYISSLFKTRSDSTFVLGDVKRITDDSMYSRDIINLLYLAKESNSTLILITSDYVYKRIAQFGLIARLDFPDQNERQQQITSFVRNSQKRYHVDWTNQDIMRASALLSGFSEIQIDNILSHELTSAGGLFQKNIFKLTSQKSKLYATASSIDPVFVDRGLCVSGLENLKLWLNENKTVFFAPNEDLNQYGLNAPKGILLAGVPGCGKSFSAKMIANQWELPLYRFDIGSVYDKWMGESERKMREALEFIDNVSPCILWIDEIEKGLAVSNSSNDTAQRILGQFLFWLQESKSKVFLVATANDTSLLPPELFRKGRFSEIFFVDLPCENERKQAIMQYAQKCLHMRFNDQQLQILSELSNGFSFAEIEYAIKSVAKTIYVHGVESVNMEIICEKFKMVVPVCKSNSDKIKTIREWGTHYAVSAHKQ